MSDLRSHGYIQPTKKTEALFSCLQAAKRQMSTANQHEKIELRAEIGRLTQEIHKAHRRGDAHE